MTFTPTSLEGSFVIQLPKFSDQRGTFVKTFQESLFLNNHINFDLKESYFSFSKKNVIRGMHFQLPPHQHAKIVFCPKGVILDVLIDLRKASSTFGHHFKTELSGENAKALYIPEGFAHGFQALTNDAMTYYLVSSEYNQEKDTGIRWDSFGMDWGSEKPVLSDRDCSFTTLEKLESPF